MKRKRLIAALTAAVCCAGNALMPVITYASENRDNVYDDSLVLSEETSQVYQSLREFLWDSETNAKRLNAYTALKQDKKTVEVISPDPDVLERVKAYVKEKGLDEELIEYRIEEAGEITGGDDTAASDEITVTAAALKGDANCDGQVDLSDAVMIMQALANPNKYGIGGTTENHLTEQGKLNGDMNGDGLTVGDAQEIQRILLGIADTPSEPTTIGFNDYEEYKKYIEENDLAEKIMTYDKLSQYGEFVQFTINSHWKYDNTFSLFYIFDDGSGKNYDLMINDLPQHSEDLTAYLKLTDEQINRADMRTADTDEDNAYYESDNKRYIYANGKLSQIKWFDDKHVYILIGNPMLYDYPNVDNTYMSKLLDISSAKIDNSEYLIGNEDVSSAASTTQKLVLNCNSFCANGETLKVDMAMGDMYTYFQTHDGYPNYDSAGNPEYSIFAAQNHKKTDDERLIINSEKSEYTKAFSKEDMESLDITGKDGDYAAYYHESAEIDFSNYEAGSTGSVTFRFGWKADGENPLNASSDFAGMNQTMYFYVGENGTGISNNGIEAAQQAYEDKSDNDIMFYDSIYVKWNGKEVMSNLYEKLRKPTDEVLPISFKLSKSPDYNFEYKGKKLSEYANANNSEYTEKLRDLMGYGNTLKYGEMAYTTGTPDGMKWTKEWYEDRIEYFGEEILSKYIVDGEFLEEDLRVDINELMKNNRIVNDEAEKAYYIYISDEAIKQLDEQNIKYEYMAEPKRLVIYVTAEEFKAMKFDNALRYGLDMSAANGLTVDAMI